VVVFCTKYYVLINIATLLLIITHIATELLRSLILSNDVIIIIII
jgi:hypothetical protein